MTDEPDLNARYSSLKKQITKHDDLYFNQEDPQITDAEYDRLYQELVILEKEYPQLVSTDSPTQYVGAPSQNTLAKISHDVPMRSLDKAFNLRQTQLFFDRCYKETGLSTFLATPKHDGVSVVITYRDHKFVHAATRGDGRQGEDVSANMRLIKNVPQKLSKKLPANFELRGEITMTHTGFIQANAVHKELGLKEFVNPRNAASGILRSKKNLKIRVLDGLAFTAFWAIESGNHNIEADELFAHLEANDVTVAKPYAKISSLEEFEEYIDKIDILRTELDQDIDGIVLRLNNLESLVKMGATAKFARGMLAYKFSDEKKSTILKGVTYQLGRTGKLTPVGELEPIELGGVVVRRVSLHNTKFIDKKDLHIGDSIVIVRSGEVIPKLVGVNLDERPANATKITKPTRCVSCGGRIKQKSMDLMCLSEDCQQVRLAFLKYFVSRLVMDIDGLGPEILEDLITKKNLRYPVEIFQLDDAKLDFLASSSGKNKHLRRDNLLAAIEKARDSSLWRVLCGLGLAGIGQTGARELEKYVGKLEKIRKASPEVLCFVPSINFGDALGLCDFLAEPELIPRELSSLTLSFSKLELEEKYAEALARRAVHPSYAPRDQIETLRQAGVNWTEQEPASLTCSSYGLLVHISYLRKVYPEGSCWPEFSEAFLKSLLHNLHKAPTIEILKDEKVLKEVVSSRLYPSTEKALTKLFAMPQFKKLRAGMEETFNLQWCLESVASSGGVVAGLKVLITGSLPGLNRQEANDLVTRHGATLASVVSAKVDLVIVGKNPGPGKLKKAGDLGLRIMDAQELLSLLDPKAK